MFFKEDITMIAGIASLVFIPLLAIAMVQLLWAFGSSYPVRDRAALARTVAGFRGATSMPSRLVSFAGAALALAAGVWALTLSDPEANLMVIAGGVVLAVGFLARGAVGYTKWWRQLTPEEPFASLDKKFYSPLCLWIGLGFVLLIALRLF